MKTTQPTHWKVLITDDQQMIHVMIKHYLSDYQFQGIGLQYIDALSGKDAISLLKNNPDIAVVILDVMLEEPDTGFQLVQYIRETLNNRLIKIIMLTGKLNIDKAKFFFMKYHIDMYCPKSDINKIYFNMTASLRAYQSSHSIHTLHQRLTKKLNNQKTAEKELKMLNRQLEQMVRHKDAQLQETHHSLNEAIVYAQELTNELETSNNARSRFLANISHEIRTPMSGIIGMLGLALNSELDKKQHEYISLAKHAADHMRFLINDILDFSKLKTDNFRINYDIFKLSDIIESAIIPLKLNALENSIEIIYDIDPKIPEFLYGAPDRLLQILINLIKNSVKFSECSDIIIKVQKNETTPLLEFHSDSQIELLFSVIDQGVGMPDDILDSIFEPFFQGHQELNESKGGLGLGLNICKQLIEMMGGQIWAESQPEKGSTFYFALLFKLIDSNGNIINSAGTASQFQTIEKTTNTIQPNILLAEDKVSKFISAPSRKTVEQKKLHITTDLNAQFDINNIKDKYKNNKDVVREKLNNFIDQGNRLIKKIESSLSLRKIPGVKYFHQLMLLAADIGAKNISDNAFRCKLAYRKNDYETANQIVPFIKKEYFSYVKQITTFLKDDSLHCQKQKRNHYNENINC